MNEIAIVILLGFLGLVIGSFAGAQVWRLRARQLRADDLRLKQLRSKKILTDEEKEEMSALADEAKARRLERSKLDVLLDASFKRDRSRCLKCRHELAWYDLLPLVSWIISGGKCRYCKQSIGYYEPLVELSMAGLFIVSYIFWPFELNSSPDWLLFTSWLAALLLMAILYIYDKKWFILPDKLNFSLVGVAVIFAALVLANDGFSGVALASLAGSVAIMSGIYLLLYMFSRGAWIGFGDVKLGVGLGLLLGRWELAFLGLFLANLIGTLIVLPGLMTGRLSRQSEVPFGPLLIIGAIISVLFGDMLISSFFELSLALF